MAILTEVSANKTEEERAERTHKGERGGPTECSPVVSVTLGATTLAWDS